MKVVRIEPESRAQACAGEVREVVMRGGIIIYPTETVYGIGADIFNMQAVAKVCSAKGRDEGKPLSIALSDVSEIGRYAHIDNEAQRKFIFKNLPGPYTVILRKRELVPDWISRDTVGIRIPEYAGVRAILKECGPLTATSANRTGQPAPVRADEVAISADLLVDGGETRYKRPSQVIDLARMEVLRE